MQMHAGPLWSHRPLFNDDPRSTLRHAHLVSHMHHGGSLGVNNMHITVAFLKIIILAV